MTLDSSESYGSSLGMCVALFVLGCSSLTPGIPQARPPRVAGPTDSARVTTSEQDGLLILTHAQTLGRHDSEQGWLANSAEELGLLWRNTDAVGGVPAVRFERYVVMGLSFHGWPCRREITGAVVGTDGTIVLQTGQEQITCEDVSVPLALVIAVPRRLLGQRALLVAPGVQHAFEFSIPDPLPAAQGQRPKAAQAPRSGVDAPLEPVPLPPPGHLQLVTLHDHNQVWVSHHSDGAINVFAAETSLARWPSEWPLTNLSVVVTWQPQSGRFLGGWDAQGFSVHGFPPLTPRRWELSPQGELLVGAPIEPRVGPIRLAQAAPQLEGPQNAWSAYASMPRRSWKDLRDGEVGLIELDLVSTPERGAQLCRALDRGGPTAGFAACPRDAPYVWGVAQRIAPTSFGVLGPLVVRRRGVRAEVIVAQTPELLLRRAR
jgi:hypothetical protein